MAYMKAFRFLNAATGLELKEVPVPTPGVGQVLVHVNAAGLCHTDCVTISGKDNLLFWQRPITLGHEIAGTIVALGSGVTNFAVGEKIVAVVGTEDPNTVQDVLSSAGWGHDGGYAEYTLVNTHKALRIPKNVSLAQAAVATDAVATAYRAVIVKGQVSSSSKVCIIGLGGLGLNAVEIAAGTGAKVYGVDLNVNKFATAIGRGAILCAKSVEKFAGVTFDVIIDLAGANITTSAAIMAVKPGGCIVLLGLASKQMNIPQYDFISKGISLLATIGSTKEDVEKSLELVSQGKIHPILEEIPFLDLPKGLDRLEQGNVVGRLYTDPSKLGVAADLAISVHN